MSSAMGGNTPLEGPLASTYGEERWSANHSPIWAFKLWWLTLLSTQQKVLGNFKVKVVKWIGANWFGGLFTSLNTVSFHGLLCL
jgi:hypothetical protein